MNAYKCNYSLISFRQYVNRDNLHSSYEEKGDCYEDYIQVSETDHSMFHVHRMRYFTIVQAEDDTASSQSSQDTLENGK